MHPLVTHGIWASPKAPPIVELTHTANSGAGALPHSFADVDTGEDRPKRIVVIAAGQISEPATYPTTCTINGDSATLDVFSSRTYGGISIFHLDVESGTSATIAINHSNGSQSNTYIKVYAIYGLAKGETTETDVFSMGSNPNTANVTISPPANSVYIGFGKAFGSNASDWDDGAIDLTNVDDSTYGVDRQGSSAYEVFTQATTGTLTFTIGGGLGQAAICVGFR